MRWASAIPTTGFSNLLLGRLPSYTRKSRHLQLLLRYARPAKLANLARAELARSRGDIVTSGRPYIYTIDTGNVCNLRCPLCPTGEQELQRPQTMMSLQTFEKVLSEIGPWAIEVILHNWGEPFLNANILDMVRATRAAGIGTTISSNLNLVRRGDDFLGEVVDSGLDHLTVSLDGTTQEVYETYRRGGDLEAVLHNMRTLLEHRRRSRAATPVVEWQFLVMKHNQHQIEDARRMAREIGVDRIRFTSAGLPFEQLADVPLARKWLSDLPDYSAYDPASIERRGYMFDERCYYLYRAMTINPGGEVSPCCVVYHSQHDFGSLVDRSLDEIWNNGYYRASRALFSRKSYSGNERTVCAACPLFKYETERARGEEREHDH